MEMVVIPFFEQKLPGFEARPTHILWLEGICYIDYLAEKSMYSLHSQAFFSEMEMFPGTGGPLLRWFLLGRISNEDGFLKTEKPSYILIRTVF